VYAELCRQVGALGRSMPVPVPAPAPAPVPVPVPVPSPIPVPIPSIEPRKAQAVKADATGATGNAMWIANMDALVNCVVTVRAHARACRLFRVDCFVSTVTGR